MSGLAPGLVSALGVFALLMLGPPARAAAPSPQGWDSLLAACVLDINDGASTAVDYDCFAARRDELRAYLDSLSGIDTEAFTALNRDARLAFLINAYNAWTVELILTAWPDLDSIRDLGGLFSSPWKKEFIPLLGSTLSLDDIEHGMIRKAGSYDEPRIHFAVNCASIGCPALRREAYRGDRLEAQLEDQTVRFLADRSRNRLRNNRLEVTSLFKWYGDDFATGWRGATTLRGFLGLYATALDLDEAARSDLESGALKLRFLDYDWSLNRR
ncbi:MAG: DUF547 domain-containing protein [Pseudomonadota bacterium]